MASRALAVVARSLPACVVTPELTEGPYYLEVDLERSDIRSNTRDRAISEGATLELGWIVFRAHGRGCVPLEGVIVDVWQCDALGMYSGVEGATGTDFLRGFQRTDADGTAVFTTIYPGWYAGRAVHIHFKIRTDPDAEAGFEFTSQLFFDDDLSRRVFRSGRYASKGPQETLNDADGIYHESGGATVLAVSREGDRYKATFEIAVQLA